MLAKGAGNRLRKGRHSANGQIYMVTTVVRGREPVFGELAVGRLLVREMMRCEHDLLLTSLAWVIMPDHLHWLFELRSDCLAKVMRFVKARSSIAIGRHLARSGTLWQAGYHDHAVRREQDLVPVARYIIANPLRAGLVTRVGDYPLWDAVWL